jgi:hypothetical protein
VDRSKQTVLNQLLIRESLLLKAWLMGAEFRVTYDIEMMVDDCMSCAII